MKPKSILLLTCAWCSLFIGVDSLFAQGTAFTYQGRLNDGANPANGSYDMTFALFNVGSGAGQVGNTVSNSAVVVSNGLFTVAIDFGGNFSGADRWLEIGVRTNGNGVVATLSPRQKITPTPYAITAVNLAGVVANNTVGGSYAAVGGGSGNNSTGNYATIGGGSLNTSAGVNGTIGGGDNNSVYSFATWGTVSGGEFNRVGNSGGTVGGGFGNESSGPYATVAGGSGNASSGFYATVGGGAGNTSSGSYATVAGGGQNTSGYFYSTISGGSQNTSSGRYAMVPGGNLNSAAGDYSLAAGNQAKAIHQGAFVWADSQAADFASTANDEFLIRAAGGVGIGVNAPQQQLSVAAGMNLDQNNVNSGTLANTLRFGSASGEAIGSNRNPGNNQYGLDFYTSSVNRMVILNTGNVGIHINDPGAALDVGGTSRIEGGNNWDVNNTEGDFRVGNDSFRFKVGVANGGAGAGDVWMRAQGGTARVLLKTPGGTTIYSNEGQTAGVFLAAGGTAWGTISDRNAKKNFAPVDSREILEKLAAMPITQWHYKWEEDSLTPHIGPMAQDFKAAFYPGTDDKSITTQEADGVALAAIQGLNQKLEDELKLRSAENTELKQRLAELEQLVVKLAGKKN